MGIKDRSELQVSCSLRGLNTHAEVGSPQLCVTAVTIFFPKGTVSPGIFFGVGQKVCYIFFYKIKYMVFIFNNNFIDLDILSMLTISRYWLLVGRGKMCC